MQKWMKYFEESEISETPKSSQMQTELLNCLLRGFDSGKVIFSTAEIENNLKDGVYFNSKDEILYKNNELCVLIKTKKIKSTLGLLKDLFVYEKQLNQKLLKEYVNKTKFTILGMMARGLSHEINNPLTIISTYCQYLLLEERSEEKKEIYNNMLETVFRANNIVKKISQIASKNDDKERFNIFSELQNILEFYENIRKYRFPDIHIDFKVNDFESRLDFDKNEFQEIIFPILDNACESYTKSGTVKIILKREGDFILVIISDNGTGIKKTDLKKTLIPFYTTKGDNLGRGLGLTLAYYLIQKNKGDLLLDSKINKGTSITIKLKGEKI